MKKMMRLGGQFEIETPEGKLSTLEARELFFRLIAMHKGGAVQDFLNPVKRDVLPQQITKNPQLYDSVSRLFILHIVNPSLFSTDLEEL